MTWMIGFKLNENSNLRCGVRMRANNDAVYVRRQNYET